MKYVEQLSMKTKLIGCLAAIILFFGVNAALNGKELQQIRKLTETRNQMSELESEALQLKETAQQLNVLSSELMIFRSTDKSDEYAKFRNKYFSLLNRITEYPLPAEHRKWRSQLIGLSNDYLYSFDMAVQLIENSKAGQLKDEDIKQNMSSLYQDTEEIKLSIFTLIDQYSEMFKVDSERALHKLDQAINRSFTQLLVLSISFVVISAIVAFGLIRSLLVPVRKLQNAVMLMAEGDLRHKIGGQASNELGKLSNGFDQMIDRMTEVLLTSRQIAQQLADESSQFRILAETTSQANTSIVEAISEISSGADQQVNQSEHGMEKMQTSDNHVLEISSSVERLHLQSEQSSYQTEKGSTAIETLSEAIQLSSQKLIKMISSMNELTQQSDRIGLIVNTITDISNQTKLLALNASIEAAHAGDHGKGFSVIAEQVRFLSQDTTDASKLISELISSLQEQMGIVQQELQETQSSIDQQNKHMDRTSKAFRIIRASVSETAEHINLIQEKSIVAKTLNAASLEAMRQVTYIAQQTAAGVEEINSISQEQDAAIKQIASRAGQYDNMSQRLYKEIQRFQL